jgi:hypothetical protein
MLVGVAAGVSTFASCFVNCSRASNSQIVIWIAVSEISAMRFLSVSLNNETFIILFVAYISSVLANIYNIKRMGVLSMKQDHKQTVTIIQQR